MIDLLVASRSVTRSPEPYRRPRNRDGEHIDPDAEGGDGEDEEDEEAAAMAAMGFGGFGSTKVGSFFRIPACRIWIGR